MRGRSCRGIAARVSVAVALVGLVAQGIVVGAGADPLLGADGQTIPREPLLTPQELGKGSVDGLQYGNPTEGLVLVAPPTPTNDGGAHLTYPLNIPPGRGITPGLQLGYDSGGGNGWAGLGWDLSVGVVSVDTRFGAPRFDPTKESESYTLDGDALVPNGLDDSTPRVNADRQDFTRQVETQYEEITRLYNTPAAGDPQQGPANYYWRVRDKMGNVKWYGGYPDAGGPTAYLRANKDGQGNVGLNGPDGGKNGIDRSAIVTDDNGNQVRWLLAAQRDVGVNMIKYHYQTLHYMNNGSGWLLLPAGSPACVSNGSTMCAQHTYLSSIEYTDGAEASKQPEDAPYHVQFLLDSQLHPNDQPRLDPTITGIGGYLDLTADRLAQVNVYYQAPLANGKGRSWDSRSPDTFTEADPAHPTAQLAVRYNLAYKAGPYDKSLLASVTQVGNDKTTQATHTFDYFNDVNATVDPNTLLVTAYKGFDASKEQTWNPGQDNLNVNPGTNVADPLYSNTGVLSSSVTNSGEGHFYIGFNPEDEAKEGSFGLVAKFGGGDTTNRSEFLDINGDGLPDKVWRNSSGIMYRKNLGGATNGTATFSAPIPVSGLNALTHEHDFNFNIGFAAFFGVTAEFGLGASFNWADAYFTDVNGDGLPDFVSHGNVLFNHVAGDTPTFTGDSSLTPAPIPAGESSNAAPGDKSALDAVKADMAKQSPLVDTIRRWVAPYTGTVSIVAPATLTPPAGTMSKDGVRVAIQINAQELDSHVLTSAGVTAFAGARSQAVHAGDRLYFRVGSLNDGANDQVSWSPSITYTAIDGVADLTKLPVDENGLNRTVYSSAADFTTSGRPGAWVEMPYGGTVHFTGTITKTAVTSDDLHLVLTRNGVAVPGSDITIPAAKVGDTVVNIPAFAVAAPTTTTDASTPPKTTTTFDHVSTYLAVNSPIDLTKVSWRPQLQYDSAFRLDTSGTTVTQVPVPTVDANGQPILVMDVTPEIEQYPYHADNAIQQTGAPSNDGTYDAVVSVTHAPDTPASQAWLTIKDANGVVAQQPMDVPATVPLDGITTVTAVVPVHAALKAATQYWFDVTLRDPRVSAPTPSATVALRPVGASDNTNDQTVPAFLSWQGLSDYFPLPYRGWGVAGYNGDGTLVNGNAVETSALDESAFTIDHSNTPKPGTVAAPTGYDSAPPSSAVSERAYAYVGVAKPPTVSPTSTPDLPAPLTTPAWQGPRANLAASGDVMRSSRRGSDSIDVGPVGAAAHAVDRTGVTAPAFAATFGIGPASLGFAIGPNYGTQDYVDMNGDGLPDVITPGKVQYTLPTGAYEPGPARSLAADHTSQDLTLGLDFGVSAGLASIPFKSKAHASATRSGKNSAIAPDAGIGTVGLGISSAWTDPPAASSGGSPFANPSVQQQAETAKNSKKAGGNLPATSMQFADVNGDGLPDMVSAGPSGVDVRYNLGYGFTPGHFTVDNGGFASNESYGGSLGGGFQTPDGSFAGGISTNFNYTFDRYSWKDVNGDGIPDRIFKPLNVGEQPRVAIGTGTGLLPETPFGDFQSTTALPGGTAYAGPHSSFSSTNGLGGGLDVTVGFPCFIFGCNIIIGVGGSFQQSNSSPQLDLQDVNGDGYLDSVKSAADGSLVVRLNQTGRTNLLAKVTNPIGGTIALDYTRAGNTPAQPSSVWTMSQVDVNDGHRGDGVNLIRKTFTYTGGRYDRLFRQSLGFATVVQNEFGCGPDSDLPGGFCGTTSLRTTTTTYSNGNVFDAGLLTGSMLKDASGNTLKELTNTWGFVDVKTGATAVLNPANIRDALAMSVSPLLARTETATYVPGSTALPIRSKMDFQYDRMGNVVTQTDYGQLDNPDDDVVATYQYSTCRTAASDDVNPPDSPSLNQVFGCGKPGVTPADQNGPVKTPPGRPSPLYSFDECATYVSLPIVFDVTNGKTGPSNVTYRHRDGRSAICDNSSVTQLDESDGTGAISTTLLAYDQWGSYNRIVYPVGENGKSYAVQYTYDPNVGHANVAIVHEFQLSAGDVDAFMADDYVSSVPDPATEFAASLGLTTTATFDPLSGRVASTTDPNGLVTKYTYDAFNRIASVSSPRATTDPPLVTYSYDLTSAGNAKAVAHNYDLFHPSDTIDTVAFVDGNGRVTQNKRDASLFQAASQPAVVGAVVSGHIDYDTLGRPIRQYNPTVGAGPFTSFDATPPAANAKQTTTSYDVFDRATQTVEPGNRITNLTYEFAQVNGSGPRLLRTTQVDPASRASITYSDVRDVQIASVDAPKNATTDPPKTTLFQSDGMGQLTQITDSAGNKTTNTYDWMGRRTSTKTPDGGAVTFSYDAEGKLASKLTANEKASTPSTPTMYHYDFGRLVKVDYPAPTPDVTYTYGGQGAPNNGAGRVISEEDGSRIQTLAYNPAGQVIKQTAEMKLHNWPGPGSTGFQWTTQWTFDGFGRLASMIYPDGESLTYGYDAGGSVNAVAGDKTWYTTVVTTNPDGTTTTTLQPTTNHYAYLNDRQYDVFLHRRFDQLGNLVTSETSFDPDTQWMTRRLTISPNRAQADAAHKTIQDLNYTYDAAGNPTTYNDNLPVPVSNLMGGATTDTYTYDGFNRVVGGTGLWQAATGKTQHYTFALAYDAAGNVTSKKQFDAVTINGKDNPVAVTTYSFTRRYPSTTGAPHQAASDSTGTYKYDADGNLLGIFDAKGKPIRTFTWDANDAMTSIVDSNGSTTYAYDDNGERRIERGPSGETAFINPFVTVLNGNVMYKHVWAADDRVATQKTLPTGLEPVYFLHKDLQASTNVVTDSGGNVFQHQEYFPTGEPWITENSTVFRTPYQYAGGYTDNTRDISNIGSRWYDQNREMFYSTDPALTNSAAVVEQPSISAAYAYAGSNPIANVDPSGNLWTPINRKYLSQLDTFQDSMKQVRTDRKQNLGQISEAVFDLTYGHSYSTYAWFRTQRKIAERLSQPLFTFEFTKDANGYHPTLKIPGFKAFNLTRKPMAPAAAPVVAAPVAPVLPDPVGPVVPAPPAGAADSITAKVQALTAAHGTALAQMNAEADQMNARASLRASRPPPTGD